ncbi:outer membrane beta-barrel protein [Tamlana sp. I1]|uniref:outer membrane beta-barrel protein n=1 Tax=Tamlana sp. I1 TaxID=2762061 RepID=UPI00188ED6DB|nr:outer membrane beta-barrel protein [Tamlana sp. I1]
MQKRVTSQNALSKNLVFIFLLVILPSVSLAQSGNGWGIKGGINYNTNGDYFDSIENAYEDPTGSAGFHLGVFGKIGGSIYFRPELVYTKTKSKYDDDDFKMQKLDAPMLLGVNIIGPLNVFGGPSFQYILNSKFGDISVNDIENDFTVGLNFGIGLNFNKLGIDLRYERGFSDNEAIFINDNIIGTESRIDTRPSQLILSVSLML